ncbi:sulfotransferase 1B1-like [Mytilus edulis]|uniref:sulfotransferase 1B1-like n=1 Tax=Mytilus edulis TaxID=6550 RepID=UPI0039F13CD0
MPQKDLLDSEGKCIKVLDVDGFYLPDFKFPSQEDDIRSMKDHYLARDDDILLCNYPKSGTHWVWEIIQMLSTQKAKFIEHTKMKGMIESMSKKSFDSLPSPRILNTHLEFPMLPTDCRRRKCKIVYTMRNPKDVAVSYYHHHHGLLMYNYDGSWDGFLERFLEGNIDYMSWFDNVRNWHKAIQEHKDYPIHVIHYEDMQQNGIEEIRKLAKFLEKPYNEKLLKDIQDKCQFESMQKDKFYDKSHWKENTNGIGIYREGKVGGWKRVFTVAQNEKFDKLFQEKIADLNLDIKFTI